MVYGFWTSSIRLDQGLGLGFVNNLYCFSLDKFNTAASILEETADWFTHEKIILKRKYIASLLDQISWGSETRGRRKLPSLSSDPSVGQSVKVMRDHVDRMKRIWASLDLKMKPVMDWLCNPLHVLDSSNERDMEQINKLIQKVAERSLPENQRSLLALSKDIANMSSFLLRREGSSSGQEETRTNLEEKLINVLAAVLKAIKKLESTANRVGKQQEKKDKCQKKSNKKRKCRDDDDNDMKENKKTRLP